MTEKLTPGKALKEARERKGLEQTELAEILGVSQGLISGYENDKIPIPTKRAKAISGILDININNLVTIDDAIRELIKPVEIAMHQRPPLVVSVDNKGNENIVLVDTPAFAGYIQHSGEVEYIKNMPTFNIPGLSGRTYRAFRVKGDSMIPKINPGDISVGEYVEHWVEDIEDDYLYIIVKDSDSDIYVKRVLNRIEDRGTLRLKSDNPEYADYEIPIDEVREVWRWKCNINFSSVNPMKDVRKQVQHVENKLEALEQTVLDFFKKIEGKLK